MSIDGRTGGVGVGDGSQNGSGTMHEYANLVATVRRPFDDLVHLNMADRMCPGCLGGYLYCCSSSIHALDHRSPETPHSFQRRHALLPLLPLFPPALPMSLFVGIRSSIMAPAKARA